MEASPVHNGGAYGDGAAESGVGFGCGAARTAGKLGQLALSSGGIGASGQDYFVERWWEDEPGNCSAARDQQGHGKSVAVQIPQAWGVRTLRRVTPGPPTPDQRRASGTISSQDAEDETPNRNALEDPANCPPDPRIENDGAPHLASVWLAAASAKTVQTFERSIFCRKGTGYCSAVFKSPGKRSSFMRG